MKKILLGTTAVVALATLSTEAFAADKIALSVGGFMRHYVGVVNHDEHNSTTANAASGKAVKLLQFSNTEIIFKGSTTLDNGIKVAVVSELEADPGAGNTRNADQNFLSLSSDALGKLEIGVTAHAGDKMLIGAPSATYYGWGAIFGTLFRNRVDNGNTAGTAANFTNASSVMVNDMGNNDAKINYYTPSFSGVTGFVSYTAAEGFETNQNPSRQASTRGATRDAAHDGMTAGLAYSGEISGVSVEADLSHLKINGSYNQTHAGLNLGMAGFTIGGGYADQNDDTTDVGAGDPERNDGKSWDLGVAYETGPYSVSASYYRSESKGTRTVGDNKDRAWLVGAGYDLGAGVNLMAQYWNAEADPEGNTVTATAGRTTKNSGVVAGIEVGF